MSGPQKIAEKKFTSQLAYEGSWGSNDQGVHESIMELWKRDATHYFIDWDIPSMDEGESIGLWFEKGSDDKLHLTDYDGVMSLPPQAIELLREQGFVVDKDFE